MIRLESYQRVQGDVKVSLKYRSIEVHKPSRDFPNGTVKSSVSIYLGEAVKHSPQRVFLPFVAFFKPKLDSISFRVEGTAFIEGSSDKVAPWILPKGNEPPGIWSFVYRDSLRIFSSLAESLHVPLPSM